MSTSRCGNICVMLPKCSRKERRRGFSNRSSVDAVMSGRRCAFLCESKITLFGFLKVDAIRNHWFTAEQHNTNVRICATHFIFIYIFICVCVRGRERERERDRVTSQWNQLLTTACVLQIHTSIITVSVTRLFPFRAWTDGKTIFFLSLVFIFTLKADALDYGKGRYISDACLWCSANHNALSAGQSEQTALVGRRGFVENYAFERGGA